MPAGGRYVPGASHRSCFYPSLQSRNPGTDKRVVSHRAKTHVEGETEIFDDGGDGPGGDDASDEVNVTNNTSTVF